MAERFISPAPLPTPYQREITTILIEECAEVQQRATKLLRFGVSEIEANQHLSNSARLSAEVGDLLETIDLALKAGILNQAFIDQGRAHKREQLARYMQTDPDDA